MAPPSDHSKAYEVKRVFLSLSFDRIMTEHWGWYQCVCISEMHRLICSMTYLGHHVTLRDLDLLTLFLVGGFRSPLLRLSCTARSVLELGPPISVTSPNLSLCVGWCTLKSATGVVPGPLWGNVAHFSNWIHPPFLGNILKGLICRRKINSASNSACPVKIG